MDSRLNFEYLQLFVLFTLHGVVSVQSKVPPSLQDPVRFISSAVKSSKPAFLLLSSISPKHLFMIQYPMLYEGIPEFQPLSLSYVQTAEINTPASLTLPSEGTIARKCSKKFQDCEGFLFYFSETNLAFLCPKLWESVFRSQGSSEIHPFVFFLPHSNEVLPTLKGRSSKHQTTSYPSCSCAQFTVTIP